MGWEDGRMEDGKKGRREGRGGDKVRRKEENMEG